MIRQVVIGILQSLPVGFSEQLSQFGPYWRRVARWGLNGRDVTLRHGVGAGLKFNCGQSNPDGALGTYELPLQRALSDCLTAGNIFYDIGANVGFFTTLAAKLVGPSGQVYAFEPFPGNAACVRHNLKLNGFSHVTILEKAVAESPGTGQLLLGKYCGGYTLSDKESASGAGTEGAIAVDLVSIDELVEQGAIAPPTAIKIDVEGFEIEVLRGMSQTLQQFKPIIIYEIDDKSKKSFDRKQKVVDDFVRSFGYQLASLADSYPEIGWHVGHVIATP